MMAAGFHPPEVESADDILRLSIRVQIFMIFRYRWRGQKQRRSTLILATLVEMVGVWENSFLIKFMIQFYLCEPNV